MPLIRNEAVEAAKRELRTKSKEEIELETAIKWGARALAAVQLGHVPEAEDYRHEAFEHASLVDDYGQTVKAMQEELERGWR